MHNLMFTSLLWLCVVFFCVGLISTSKDEWLSRFETDATKQIQFDYQYSPICTAVDERTLVANTKPTTLCTWRISRYIPAKSPSNHTQLIPRLIFQTWRSNVAAGPHHFRCMTSFSTDNPDYDYYLLDDAAAVSFMRTFHPDYASLFEKILPGAMRADLLRLAVIARYGGVYFDSDSCSTTPLSQFVWANASVVSGIGASGDLHQWALLYQPNHVIVRSALKFAFFRLSSLYKQKIAGSVGHTTGPGAFHAATKEVFLTHNCSVPLHARRNTKPSDVVHYLPNHYCSREVGVMQIYAGDHLGGNVVFKDVRAEHEMRSFSIHYSHSQRLFSTLFRADQSNAAAQSIKVGERDPKLFVRKRVRVPN